MPLEFESILVDSSRKLADITAEQVGTNQELFDELLEISLKGIPKISARAARVVDICIEKHKGFIDNCLETIISNAISHPDESVRRNFLKILSESDLTRTEIPGQLVDVCFENISSENLPAIKVYSLEVLYKITLIYPEMKHELKAVIDDQSGRNSAAFEYRSKKVLSALKNLKEK